MCVGGLGLHTQILAPVSAVQVYTRQFICTSIQLLQAMCIYYNWVKQSVFALPYTALRRFFVLVWSLELKIKIGGRSDQWLLRYSTFNKFRLSSILSLGFLSIYIQKINLDKEVKFSSSVSRQGQVILFPYSVSTSPRILWQFWGKLK
jgi:hypothetical protein